MALADQFWTDFWRNEAAKSKNADPQSQVLRTLEKKPVSPDVWNSTVAFILDQLELQPSHNVLDLCGGNGLFAKEIAKHCNEVLVVDVCAELLENAAGDSKNVKCKQCDIRLLDFEPKQFDRIFFYAGVQYLSHSETTRLFAKLSSWLSDEGRLYLGDIPDQEKIWNFYNTPERQSVYFENIASAKAIVGTWYEHQWLENLARHVGFRTAKTICQPDDQIYSWFRFDLVANK